MVSLAYLSQIFGRLNELNLPGKDKTKHSTQFQQLKENLNELWERKMTLAKRQCFFTFNNFIEDIEHMRLPCYDVKSRMGGLI